MKLLVARDASCPLAPDSSLEWNVKPPPTAAVSYCTVRPAGRTRFPAAAAVSPDQGWGNPGGASLGAEYPGGRGG